ncbi:MAG: choice-of-anchor J domain-containing protein [Bacteroidota bacterium]
MKKLLLAVFAMVLWVGCSWGQTITLGTQVVASGTSGIGPTNYYWESRRIQWVYTAAEILAAGGSGGTITSLAYDVSQIAGGNLLNYEIKMAHTTATDASTHNTATLATVKNSHTFLPGSTGWRTITFDNNFIWNGSDNILIDVCWGVDAGYSSTGQVWLYNNVANQMRGVTSGSANQCGTATSTTRSGKPRIQFTIIPAGIANPTAFTALPFNDSQIDLSWTLNGAGNNVMLVWNSTNTFGIPEDGTAYSVDAEVPGGGIVLQNNANTVFSHTLLTANTPYYYKIYSVDGTNIYSTGVTASATTFGPPSCAVISTPSNAGTDVLISATLNWTSGGGAPTGYRLSLGTDNPPTDILLDADQGNVLTYNPTPDLNYNTTYYWSVTPYNTYGNPTGCAVWSFTTAPDPTIVNFPYTQNFDGTWSGSPAAPYGWTVINANSDSYTWNRNNTYITPTHSLPYAAHGMGNTNDYLISPPISLGSIDARIKWWDKVESASYVNSYRVLVSTTTPDISSFTNDLGIYNCSNTAWTEHILELSSFTGTIYVAFYQLASASTYYGFGIDDFTIEEIPSCQEPGSLSTGNITSTSVDISWVAPLIGSPIGYDWEIRTSGLPGSGGESAAGSTGAGVTTHNVTGLVANTNYSFYVRSDCGSGSLSTWAGPSVFYTGYCIPAPTSVDGSGIINVVFSTVSNSTGPEAGNYGNYSAQIGDVQQGVNIPVAITYATGYTYDTKIWIDWNDDLDFIDSGEEVYTGTSLATNPTTLNASFIVPLTATLGNHRMRIGGVDVGPPTPCYTGTYGSYEDYTVNVEPAPACPTPTGLTVSNNTTIGAKLEWSSPDSFFDIFLELSGAPAPDENTTPTVDDNPGTTYVWEGGIPATEYDFYVRADCGGGEYSDWAGPFTFSTLCEAISGFPYTETFSEGIVPPMCWSEINSNSDYNWKYNSSNGGFADVEYDPAPADQDEWLVSPEFDFSGLTHPRLTFDWLSSYYWFVDPYDNADFVCNISLDGGATWIPIWDEEDEGVFTNYTWYTKRIDLTLYAGEPSVKFAFQYVGYDAAQSGIDNFKINEVLAATWTGATSSVWTLAGNWNPDVPGANTNVIIPGGLTNYPTLTAAASCNNFTIQSGGSFIGSEFLTVNGTTTIERSIDAYSSETAADGWHLVSSPVANQAISGGWTPATGYDFYALDESVAEYWLNQKNHPEMTSFIPGKGYLVAYEVAGTKTFSGGLNTAAVTLSGLTNTPGTYAGSHLVGNPFTSAINSASFTGTNVAANVQVWNSTNAAYEVAATIPALNGFMVYTTGAGELTIPLAARTHTGPAWFKSGSEGMILLQVNDTERHMAQKSIVRFNTQSTEAFDMEFDAYFLAGFAPMFYSKSAGEGFALNTLPALTNETVIPFDFIKNESSEFNIELVQAVPGTIIYLTDKKNSNVVNLTETPAYQFTAVEGDMNDRFLLTFGAVGISIPDATRVNIYAYRDMVFINGAIAGSEVRITNLLGQEMIRTLVKGSELNTVNAGNLANGVYVVSLISGNKVVSKKVVLDK